MTFEIFIFTNGSNLHLIPLEQSVVKNEQKIIFILNIKIIILKSKNCKV